MCVHDRCSTKLYWLKKRLQQAHVTSVPLHEVAWKFSNALVYVGSLFANGIDTNSRQFAMRMYSNKYIILFDMFYLKNQRGHVYWNHQFKGDVYIRDGAVAGWWRRFHSVYV